MNESLNKSLSESLMKSRREPAKESLSEEPFVRSEMLWGKKAVCSLRAAHVAVFGVGGVGSFAAEALARAGVGTLTLVDHDTVSASNLNRQLIALHSTLGRPKVEVMRERILDINPQATVHALPIFYPQESAAAFDKTAFDGAGFDRPAFHMAAFDFVIDAIDTVSSKIALIVAAQAAGVPIVSCMGAGNRLDPTKIVVVDLWSTSGCPLARVLRKELRTRGVERLTVVHSTEPPLKPLFAIEDAQRRSTPGSVPFVPPVAGMTAASVAVRALIDKMGDTVDLDPN